MVRLVLLIALSGLAAGCSSGEPGSDAGSEITAGTLPMKIKTPPAGDLNRAVTTARRDLAKRTGLPEPQLTVIVAEAVTWRDASLGCPQPDMMYTQALVEGYLIRFAAGGKVYEYHGAAGGEPVYCPRESIRPPLSRRPNEA